MALNYVTLTLDMYDGSGAQISQGAATFTPSVQLTDSVDHQDIPQAPVQAFFRAGVALPTVSLLATDNANVQPSGWGWTVSFQNVPGNPASFSFFLPFSGGSAQRLSQLAPVSSVTTMQAYMPLSGGQFTGAVSPAAVVLTDGPTITLDASQGNLFRVTLGGNRLLANPVNGTDGQLLRLELIEDASGSRTLTYGNQFDFGASGAPVLSTAPNAVDVLGLAYDAAAATPWRVLAFAQGY